jgi:rubredoxin
MKLRELAKELKPFVVDKSQLFILVWRQNREWEYKTIWDRDAAVEWTTEAKEEMKQWQADVAEVRGLDPYATIMEIPDFFSPAIDSIQARIVYFYEARHLEVDDIEHCGNCGGTDFERLPQNDTPDSTAYKCRFCGTLSWIVADTEGKQ